MHVVPTEYVCDGFIEVTLLSVALTTFGDELVTLAPGTKVDAPCGKTVAADDPAVTRFESLGAEWHCPRCSKFNVHRNTTK
jgi:rubredoxin